MDRYRRPTRQKVAQRTLDGVETPKQKQTVAETNPQPYRAHVENQARQATIAPVPTAQPRVDERPLFDMALDDVQPASRHYKQPKLRVAGQAKGALKRSAIVMVLVVFVIGGVLFSQGLFNINRIFKGTAKQAASLQAEVDPNKLKGEGDGRVNILLTGIGGEKHQGGELTDTLMLASVDPVNDTASLLSVPRDLWVTVPGKGGMKINAAYATAKAEYVRKNKVAPTDTKATQVGFTAIDQTIEQVLGVPVHYNLLVNFQAFRQAVDTVGGITVDVPQDLYDPTMAWENNKDPYLARQGEQNFDGVKALMYARSRETSSDFARSERQRSVLLALKEKTVSKDIIANPTKLSRLIGAFGSNVQTDFSLGDASRLYSIFKKINNGKIESISLAGATDTTSSAAASDGLVTTGTINAQSIVMPKAGLDNYDAIQEFVRGKLRDGYITKEKAKVLIVNGTVESGLAQRHAEKLKSYGYNVVGVTSTETEFYDTTKVVDLSKGKKKYTKHYLEQRYTTTATKQLNAAGISPGTADFVVLLGGDEAGTN